MLEKSWKHRWRNPFLSCLFRLSANTALSQLYWTLLQKYNVRKKKKTNKLFYLNKNWDHGAQLCSVLQSPWPYWFILCAAQPVVTWVYLCRSRVWSDKAPSLNLPALGGEGPPAVVWVVCDRKVKDEGGRRGETGTGRGKGAKRSEISRGEIWWCEAKEDTCLSWSV